VTTSGVLPDLNAGCSMADNGGHRQVEACWNELGSVTDRARYPVTYMNSTAPSNRYGRARRLGVPSNECAGGDEVGVRARRKGFVSAGRTPWTQHRIPDGDSAGRNDCLGSIPRKLGGNSEEQIRAAK